MRSDLDNRKYDEVQSKQKITQPQTTDYDAAKARPLSAISSPTRHIQNTMQSAKRPTSAIKQQELSSVAFDGVSSLEIGTKSFSNIAGREGIVADGKSIVDISVSDLKKEIDANSLRQVVGD